MTDGEYFPVTPSFAASLPFAPEYFGKSNLPPSSEKWRWPLPSCGFLPTSFASSLKFDRVTTAVNFDPTFESGFGFLNATPIFGPFTCCGAGAGVVDALELLSLLSLPQAASATAASAAAGSARYLL